jgi:hypothetical protein
VILVTILHAKGMKPARVWSCPVRGLQISVAWQLVFLKIWTFILFYIVSEDFCILFSSDYKLLRLYTCWNDVANES